jgi:hypothetical protein
MVYDEWILYSLHTNAVACMYAICPCMIIPNIATKGKAVSTVTGLEWPRGFQEIKVPRFHNNGTGWW